MTDTLVEPTTGGRAEALAPTLALVAWTLFVWLGRIRNVVADDHLAGWSLVWRLALAVSFVAMAAVTLGITAWWLSGTLHRTSDPPRALRRAASVLALYGIGVWLVRGIGIALGDHGPGFVAVHLALAAVTIALGALVVRVNGLPFGGRSVRGR